MKLSRETHDLDQTFPATITGIALVIPIVKSMVIVMKILFILNVIQTLTVRLVPTVAQTVFVMKNIIITASAILTMIVRLITTVPPTASAITCTDA